MLQLRSRPRRRESLITGYSSQIARFVERNDLEAAATAAEEVAAIAEMRREAMEAANRTKSEFLANMSHELRTPLNAIIGFSDMMMHSLTTTRDMEKFLEYARDINHSGHHLLALINDILDLSKIEAGKLDVNETEIDLHEMAKQCLTIVSPNAEENKLEMILRIPPDMPPLLADERKIKQVCINLLSNAVKFTEPGGRIVVTAGMSREKEIFLRVTDTGIGIAARDIEKALAPFTQIDGALNRHHEGTGLGLPLSKALMELHGGTLILQSELGAGTTVTIHFPRERTIG